MMLRVSVMVLVPLLWLSTAEQDMEENPYETYTYMPVDPEFLDTPQNVTFREGGSALLPCSILHLGTKRVAWRRVDGDEFLTIADLSWAEDTAFSVQNEKLKGDVSEWNLVIDKVTPLHAGMYECQITARGGYIRHIRLNVVGPPITEPGPFEEPAISLSGTDFVERGEAIELVCNATGGTQIAEDIDWFKDGNIIDTSRRRHKGIVILKYRSLKEGALVSKLCIDHADMDDAGTYVCRSSYNQLGDFVVNVLAADSNNVKRGSQAELALGRSSGSTAITPHVTPAPAPVPASAADDVKYPSARGGTHPSNSTGCRTQFQPQCLRLLLCCWLLLYGTWPSCGW